MNVLIIDDEADSMRALYASLPISIRWAATRGDMEYELSRTEFDAILIDGNLVGWGKYRGESGDGFQVVAELRNRGVSTNIVMFSSDDKMNQSGIAAGANAVWNKKRRWEDPNWRTTLLAVLA